MSSNKRRLVVATGNAHKLKEIAEIFTQFEVISQKQAGFFEEVEETGESFTENALIKARAAAKALQLPALGDDSGLCVDALGGAPGIFSARYGGEHGNDAKNRALLLKNLEGERNRRAYFACALAFVEPDGRELTVEGRTYGEILEMEEGEGGFGYDPVFHSEDLNKSFGVATADEKNAVSHRGRALQALLLEMQEHEV